MNLLMSLWAIPFPAIDPVALQIGPVAIKWYGLAYVAGLLLGWLYIRRLLCRAAAVARRQAAVRRRARSTICCSI